MYVFSKILVIIFIFIILWSNLRIFSTHLLISFDGRFLALMFDDLFSFSRALDLPCFDLTGFCLEHSVSGTIFLLSSFILFWLKFFFCILFLCRKRVSHQALWYKYLFSLRLCIPSCNSQVDGIKDLVRWLVVLLCEPHEWDVLFL